MNQSVPVLEFLAGISFLLSLLLFLITGSRRRKLDAALRAAAVARGAARDAPQLGLFGEWKPSAQSVLAQPERRWTYDQEYMIAFIEAAAAEPVSNGEAEESSLSFYFASVLSLDIAFAALFALFIVSAAFLFAAWCSAWPWAARAWIWSGSMGVLYGVADVAEDLKLRGILRHAKKIAAASEEGTALQRDTLLADAAQVDASNALTRVKILTIVLSGTGLLAFCIMVAADKLVSLFDVPRSGSPTSGATAVDPGGGPSLGTPATA